MPSNLILAPLIHNNFIVIRVDTRGNSQMNGFVNFITLLFLRGREREREESQKNTEEVKYAVLESWTLSTYRLFPTNKLSILSLDLW